MNTKLEGKIKETNQKYLLKYVGKEIPPTKERQLEAYDWSYLDLIQKKSHERGEFSPLKAMTREVIEQNINSYRRVGLEAIQAGKVGAILLAGGQGTRLGFDKAKGMYNFGVTKEKFIFEQLIENLQKVVKEADCWIPLYIMTSDKNDKDTRDFFVAHDFFGYNKEYVKFFVQEMVPAVDFQGNLLVESPDSLAMSPNGNGGWFKSLLNAGLD